MVNLDDLELNDILSRSGRPAVHVRRRRNDQGEVLSNESSSHYQWTSSDGDKFFPAGRPYNTLPPGLWEPKYCHSRGYFCEKLKCNTNDLLEFPETHCERVVKEIRKFWDREERFRKNNLVYKRGIILWGPPGSGKSSTIKLVLKDVFERNGVAMKFDQPPMFLEVVRIFRKIEPNTPLVVLMEDIDAIIEEWGETDVLNILDGVEVLDKVVYLATTNYPEKLGERIINRPSRFDRRFKMPHPGRKSRRLYFEHLLKTNEYQIDIDKWVKDTEGMSISHLKELFIAVCILEDDYKSVIKTLQTMVEETVSSNEDGNNLGFAQFKNEED
ncbi:MAG: ATP-binding protein [Crenarchaeota archaeon]|nr:MAG: ATP-binding protein [Thermoproteota archaeon]